jgi:hypothetical protein
MKLWLDDIRLPPPNWHWVKSAKEAIILLDSGVVKEISLDHDLGDDMIMGTGYDVAVAIEQGAFNGTLAPLVWNVHSANPVGIQKMLQALRNADRFWEQA